MYERPSHTYKNGSVISQSCSDSMLTPFVTSTAHFCHMHCVLWILIFLCISTRQKACTFTSFRSFRCSMEKFPQLTINIDHSLSFSAILLSDKNRQVTQVYLTWIDRKLCLLRNYIRCTMVCWWEKIALEKNELVTMRSFSSWKYLSSKIHRHYVLLVSSEKPGNSETSLGCFKMNSIFVCLYFSQDCHRKTK